MHLYDGGRLVLQQSSEDGIIEVIDCDNSRSLHFGTYPRQSSMSLRYPHQLQLSYTQAMMACLLFKPVPENVLIIGLGGGSLVKFLLRHFPDCRVTVVENRADVIAVAHKYFDVPEDTPRLQIIHGDGYQFVSDWFYQAKPAFDLLLVDAYDHEGMARHMGAQIFFDACAGILQPDGIMSINLWGSDRQAFDRTMQRIDQSFSQQSLILPVIDKGNVVAFGFNHDKQNIKLKQMRSLAESMEMTLQIKLPQSLQRMKRRNQSFISKLFI